MPFTRTVRRPLTLALVLALSTVAGAQSQTTLTLVADSNIQMALQGIIDAYQKLNPNVRINATFAPTDQILVSVRTRLGAGNAPDLFSVYPGAGSALSVIPLVQAKQLLELSDQPWVSGIPSTFNDVLKVGGKAYFFPPTQTTIGAIYNEDAFKALKIAVPSTWNEVLQMCDSAKAAGKVAFALGNKDSWVTQLIPYALVPTTVYAVNRTFDAQQKAGKASFAASGWREAFTKYLEMNTRGCFNANPNGTSFQQQTQLVASGEAIAAVSVAGILPLIQANNKDAKLAMFPLPGSNTPGRNWIPAAPSVGLGIAPTSKNVTAAKAFLNYFSQNVDTYAQLASELPLAVTASTKVVPALTRMLPFIRTKKTALFMDQRWPSPEVQQVHLAGIQELFGGRTTVPALLQKMDQTYNK
jgi:raffinose/stachyose/melibiose transport system substrate-binding protein